MRLNLPIFLLTLLLLSGCGSDKKNSDQNNKSEATQETMTTRQDTMPNAPESLAPNSALIKGNITEIKGTGGKKQISLKIKITKVDGYGPSTRPIATGSVIDAEVSRSFLQDKLGQELTKGDTIHAVISQTIAMLGSNRQSTWNIVDFKN